MSLLRLGNVAFKFCVTLYLGTLLYKELLSAVFLASKNK